MSGTAIAEISNAAPLAPSRRPINIRVVEDAIDVLDTARFEHMQRIATVMAESSLIPDALCMTGDKDHRQLLPIKQIMANCFLVVNQAVRWHMDPFAVAQCVSVVHGRLCYEGKLIAAVLERTLGVKLEYAFSGEGDAMKIVVSATLDGVVVVDSKGNPKIIEGSVADWKTTHSGSPWSAPGGKVRMLRYRGGREWTRVYEPGVILGVYSDDEMEDTRARRSRDVTDQAEDEPPNPNAMLAGPATTVVEVGGPVTAAELEAAAKIGEPATDETTVEATDQVVWEDEAPDPAATATASDEALKRQQAEEDKARAQALADAKAAEKAAAPVEAVTPAKVAPFQIPTTGDTKTFGAWSAAYWEGVKTATALAEVTEWKRLNKQVLTQLEAGAPDIFKTLDERVVEHIATRVDVDKKPVEAAKTAAPTVDDGLDIPDMLKRTRADKKAAAEPSTKAPTVVEAAAAPVVEAFDGKEWLRELGGALSGCEDMECLAKFQKEMMLPAKAKASAPQWDAAKKLIETHLRRVQQSILEGC